MDFTIFSKAVHAKFQALTEFKLYKVALTKAEIWDAYLNAFPEGTNEIYKERREYDCQCCAQFVRTIGNVVAVMPDGRKISVWDCEVGGHFQIVCDVLADLVRNAPIENYFIHTEKQFGQEQTTQTLEDGNTINWNHFHCRLPNSLHKGQDTRKLLGQSTTNMSVFLRGLNEIKPDAIEIVLDLISQGSLYKGDEFKANVSAFKNLQDNYLYCDEKERSTYRWVNLSNSAALIKHSVIGTLLMDISEEVELEKAVKSYDLKTAPTNYKRTTALVTPAMIEKAMTKINDLGLRDSLDRRFAVPADISINNVLFADRATGKVMQDSLMEDLLSSAKKSTKSLDGISEIGIEEFIKDVLPNIDSMEIEVKNNHKNNMVSLIGPKFPDCEKLFTWNNRFSWSYVGDITDSIKEKVKRAGGDVDGVLRVSLGWYNGDDLDIHLIEPDGTKIFFSRHTSHKTKGHLDVDMNAGGKTNTVDPVENITYPQLKNMPDGKYQVKVHQYSKRCTDSVGFEIDIAWFGGESHIYSYPLAVTQKEVVNCLTVQKTGSSFKIINIHPNLDVEGKSKELWNINTENFQKVSIMCLSPNYWNDQEIGNKHYLFMLDGCENPDSTRGIYNEFLRSDLHEHRKVLELVGSKTKCPQTNEQLSGLGFSSTIRSSIVVKVEGSFNRTLKINF